MTTPTADRAPTRVVSRALAACAGRARGPLVLLSASLVIVAHALTRPYAHDEQMYCAAAALVAQGQAIYRDFPYLAQWPLHPLVVGLVIRSTQTTWLLLTGRLISVAADLVVLCSIASIYKTALTRGSRIALVRGRGVGDPAAWVGALAAALWMLHPTVFDASGVAWNHDVVLALLMVAFRLALPPATVDRAPGRQARLAAVTALVTAATCMRITAALPGCLLVRWAWRMEARRAPSDSGERTATRAGADLAVMVVAAGLVAAWPLATILAAPHASYVNLVRLPQLNGAWLRETGFAHAPSTLVLATVACIPSLTLALLFGMPWLGGRTTVRLDAYERAGLGLGLAMAAASVLAAFVPPAMWPQYWALPIPFLIAAAAFPLAAARRAALQGNRPSQEVDESLLASAPLVASAPMLAPWRRSVFVLAVGVVVSWLALPDAWQAVAALRRPEEWPPVRIHRTAEAIAALPGIGPGPILTLNPLLALEGGRPIYPGLAAGVFGLRVADRLSPDERASAGVVAPADIGDLVRREPPAAVVLGVEPPALETSLRAVLASLATTGTVVGTDRVTVHVVRSGRDQRPAAPTVGN